MLITRIKKVYKTRTDTDVPTQSHGPKGQKQNEPVCEHQSAAAGQVNNELALGDLNPELDHKLPAGEQRDSKTCAQCVAEKKAAKIYSWKLILALLIPNIMASMDLTITATALPVIASHFSKFNEFNWIVTAFTLSSTSSIPLYGQISDVFGRHSVIQSSIFFVLIGSVLAAGAQAWAMLLVGRALQGLGFAGLQIVTRIILSDKVSLKQNSSNNTLFALLNGFAMGGGPVIGGYLTKANWRWCFIINVPVAVLSHFAVFFLLRKELVKAQPHTREDADGKITVIETPTILAKLSIIDFGGMLLFFFGTGLVVLAVTWAGSTYTWKSAAVLAPLVLGGLIFLSFLAYEYMMGPGRPLAKIFPRQEPMIPLDLFRTKDISLLTYLNFSTGMALFSVFYFVGLWFAVVEEYNSGKSGTQLVYYIPGLGVGAYGAMFICNVWPKQTFLPLFLGSTLEPIGVGMLTWALHNGRISIISGMLAFAGVGTGLRMMPGMLHAVGMRSRFKSRGLAIMSFSTTFGGTVGIAIMGSVFDNKLSNDISGVVGINPHATSRVSSIESLPPTEKAQVRAWVSDAVFWAYVSVLPFLGLAGLLVCFLGNVKITDQKQNLNGEIDTSQNVEGVYLWWLITGGRRRAAKQQTQVEASHEG